MSEASQVGEIRRLVTALARRLGFGETEEGKVAVVATELAGNLVKHARDGVILVRSLVETECLGIELLALDRGPGMADVGRCLRDGYSTTSSPGTGLGAISRLSHFADIYSLPSMGTASLVHLYAKKPARVSGRTLRTGVVSVPKQGEEVCGDAWAIEQQNGLSTVMVADGLGHGPLAAEAAQLAVRIFRENPRLRPAELLQLMHRALRPTRGAAVAIAEVDLGKQVVCCAGVGNIAGSIRVNDTSRSMVSHNGTIGHEARYFQEFTYPFSRGATLILHSDGLISRWSLDPYPGLICRDPALLAGILYRDFQRGRDDVTVVVARQEGEAGS